MQNVVLFKKTNDYFFVEVKGKPVCLVCGDALAVMKKANLEHYYSSKHAKLNELQGQMHLDKVNTLQQNLSAQQAVFTRPHSDRENVIHASFVVSKLIAKKIRSHSEGEFVKKCLVATAELLTPDKVKFSSALVGFSIVYSALVGFSSTLVGFSIVYSAPVCISSALVGISFICSTLAGFLLCSFSWTSIAWTLHSIPPSSSTTLPLLLERLEAISFEWGTVTVTRRTTLHFPASLLPLTCTPS